MRKEVEFVGISNAPSDYAAQDGVMSHLVNLIPEDGELKAVGRGKRLWSVPYGDGETIPKYDLLYVHSVSSEGKHYIFYCDNALYYQVDPTGEDGSKDFKLIGNVNGKPSIVSVGNTIIACSENEMRYFLWKSYGTPVSTNKPIFQYVDLGTHLPEPDVRFMLKKYYYDDQWSEQDKKELVVSPTQILFKCNPNDNNWGKDENQRYIEEQVCALVNKAHQTVTYYGGFMFPFLVRYAYRLYDGSTLTLHSAPILMLPSMSDAVQIVGDRLLDDDTKLQAWVRWLSGELFCRVIYNSVDLFNFGDVIKSIDVFVSSPIYTYKQSGLDVINDTSKYDLLSETVSSFGFLTADDVSDYDENGLIPLPNTYHFGDTEAKGLFFIRPPKYSDSEIQKDVSNKSLFYLLKSIPFTTDGVGTYSQFAQIPIPKGYLTSLVNKEVMTDDYDSHDLLKPQSAFVYNSRLNIANISKILFNGWTADKMSFDSGFRADSKKVEIKNRIKTEYGDVVKGSPAVSVNNLGFYFYYPNTRASDMILSDGDRTTNIPLESHAFLNGAFAIIPFWKNIKSVLGYLNWSTESLPNTSDFDIVLSNKVYTSAVNMPFYFPITGINTIGVGEIYSLASTTQALSEGQFGQYPLYAFTSEGIWALQINDNGGIASVTPVSRDVCNNKESITQIDDAILFSTDRGLMILQGSQTQCLSDSLNGEWFSPSTFKQWDKIAELCDSPNLAFGLFREFLKGSHIVYDYNRQRVLICHPQNSTALAYSLKSKQWGQARIGAVMNVVNSYPNAVVQTPHTRKAGTTEIVDVSMESTDKVKVLAISRPITFGDADIFKTVNAVISRGDDVSVILYGTRDMNTWQLVASSKNRHLFGMQGSPYKAYRLLLVGTLVPGQHITRASFDVAIKDDNKMR